MRTVTEQQPTPALEVPPIPVTPPTTVETFSATLRSGKVVTIREMTGKDLVHIEEELVNMGETRRSFHIIELLNVGENKYSYEDIESLGVRDIKTISDLIGKANGDTADSEESPPK
jgi:hypothetical protein